MPQPGSRWSEQVQAHRPPRVRQSTGCADHH
jgi:hypothetical protein